MKSATSSGWKHPLRRLMPALGSLLACAGMAHAQTAKQPNILLFLVDDMGWQDTSLPFWKEVTPLNKRFHTPNMERLAREGMMFVNAYANSVSTPTRVSLLTGMNAAHHGVTNWTSPWKNNNTDGADEQFDPAPWNINGLSPLRGIAATVCATPLPQLLKDAGYYTIHVGKAHWGSMGTPGSSPDNMGFMVNIAGHAAGHPQSYLGKENYGNLPGKATAQAVPDLEEFFDSETFLTEALTLKAIRALEVPVGQKRPFFLNMAHYAVHTPLMADKRFLQRYLDAGMDSTEARYASMIEGMDKSLGDLMDYLAAKGIEKNTVVLFMSDNGGLSLAPPRGGSPHSQNLPLKAGKGSLYEGGIREPMVVRWPGQVPPHSRTEQCVIVEDFFPTLLQIAGVSAARCLQTVDGVSFLPALQHPEQTDTTRLLIWHYPNKWVAKDGPGINYFSAIRQGSWKLIYSMRTGKKELYFLKQDIGETRDLAAQYPERTKALSHLLSERLRSWHAPMPVIKANGKAVPMADELP
ncbi:MAG: sulfatase [Marinilabiliales bacterium]|nr:sulfatase [Marinilabiliales bacterium]